MNSSSAITEISLFSEIKLRLDGGAPTIWIHRRPKTKLKTAGMSRKTNGISNSQAPVRTFSSISPRATVFAPSKARTITSSGQSRDRSPLSQSKVTDGQTFNVDLLSSRAIIIPLHSIEMCTDLMCPLPYGSKLVFDKRACLS